MKHGQITGVGCDSDLMALFAPAVNPATCTKYAEEPDQDGIKLLKLCAKGASRAVTPNALLDFVTEIEGLGLRDLYACTISVAPGPIL